MTNPSTFTGKNLEAALQKAAQAMSTTPDAIRYEVLAGKTGGYALIRVIGTEPKESAKLVESLTGVPGAGGDDRGDRGGDRDRRDTRSDDRRGPPRDDRRGPPPRDGGGRDDRRGPPPRDGAARDDRRGPPRDDRRGPPREGGRDDRRGPPRDGGGRDDRRGDDRRERRPRREDRDELLPVPQDGPTEITFEQVGEVSAYALTARDVLVGILSRMQFGMKLTLAETADEISIDLIGPAYHDAFVARELELLDALEHLLEKALHEQADNDDPRKRVHLDSNAFRAKADIDLALSAKQMADRATAEQRVFKLGPLDPRARRVVHMTLKDVPGVQTKSEGEGVFRRVCIIPQGAESNETTIASHGDD